MGKQWMLLRKRSVGASFVLAIACLPIMLILGCAKTGGAADGPSASGGPQSASPSTSVSPSAGYDLSASVEALRSAIRGAFVSGRDGEPLGAASPQVVAALERYFASVDPAEFNEASRVAFIWAFTVRRPPTGAHSTSTRHFVEAYFWAEGESMVAAGSMAPGFNAHLMTLSRSSAGQAWQVDGLYNP